MATAASRFTSSAPRASLPWDAARERTPRDTTSPTLSRISPRPSGSSRRAASTTGSTTAWSATPRSRCSSRTHSATWSSYSSRDGRTTDRRDNEAVSERTRSPTTPRAARPDHQERALQNADKVALKYADAITDTNRDGSGTHADDLVPVGRVLVRVCDPHEERIVEEASDELHAD